MFIPVLTGTRYFSTHLPMRWLILRSRKKLIFFPTVWTLCLIYFATCCLGKSAKCFPFWQRIKIKHASKTSPEKHERRKKERKFYAVVKPQQLLLMVCVCKVFRKFVLHEANIFPQIILNFHKNFSARERLELLSNRWRLMIKVSNFWLMTNFLDSHQLQCPMKNPSGV
jgi:hypothetical protein